MSVDDCEHTFHELAHVVLPGYLKDLRQKMAFSVPMADFGIKGVGPVTLRRRFNLDKEPSGCHVLTDEGRPVYVGISRAVITRLREHVLGTDHMTATLAYKIAATRHPHGMTATLAMEDREFRLRFQESRDYLMGLSTAWVEIPNPLELYFFEPYCAMELGTGINMGGWNTFVTH